MYSKCILAFMTFEFVHLSLMQKPFSFAFMIVNLTILYIIIKNLSTCVFTKNIIIKYFCLNFYLTFYTIFTYIFVVCTYLTLEAALFITQCDFESKKNPRGFHRIFSKPYEDKGSVIIPKSSLVWELNCGLGKISTHNCLSQVHI